MNSNFFGSQQGAFQAPNNTRQGGGMFQGFGQQGTSSITQNAAFGQTSTFGQLPSFGQQPVFGQGTGQTSVFGQTPTFGQSHSFGQSGGQGQSTSFSSIAQTSALGHPSAGQASLRFGAPSASAGQSAASAPAFGGGMGNNFGFGQTSGQPTFTSAGTGPTQPSLDQLFSQPSAFSLPSGTPGSTTSTQSSAQAGGTGTNFSFKPSNESVFKPIFSVSPEPSHSKPALESFALFKPTVSGSDSGGSGMHGVLLFSKEPSGFSFSQPGAAPSVSTTSANVVQKEPAAANPFTFSQPAIPSNSGSNLTTATISSSAASFSVMTTNAQTQPEFSGFPPKTFTQPPFVFRSPKTEQRPEGREDEESFVSFPKGTKRKVSAEPIPRQGNTSKSEESQGGIDGPTVQPKRPLQRNLLFKSALSGVLKTSTNVVRKEDREDRQETSASVAEIPVAPPRAERPISQALMAENPTPEPEVEKTTPVRRAQRGESTDSLAGLSPSEATAIQCKGIPPALNRKDLIEKHFGRFGKVRRVYCRPQKNLAVIHFHDHSSAAKAKKRGKNLEGSEIQIFWQRRKPSPGEKPQKPSDVKNFNTEEESRPMVSLSTPLRKPLPKSPVASSSSLTKGFSAVKPSIAKTLQFDMTERSHEVGTEGQSLERLQIPMPSSLQHLIGQVAETAEEKYRLLEQRDKILRQLRPKRTDLDLSKVFVGSCPDMCPEKERYMRETRNQLSVFEVIPDTEKVDHYAAIKEYSRSSADQEEPLPHELRPLPVLNMTMNYLVTRIVDQGEGICGEWYDFVWNRTRGIRKDITQQHLCDPMTVSLIEKCARFHIHCAHHLCQEPMQSFDAKINNENLTKCLQSLKEMYQDLATKEVFCPNEAEFRQYSVLLKLNDGDILREVQQFCKGIRDSTEVKFAVQVFAALNSNNFVRFFKLVKAASYLGSCILHRYFNQVRYAALKSINVAYTVSSQRPTAFPLEDVVRMFMFRNASEATDFLQHYGLSISDGLVELSRTSYQEPDLPLKQKKSLIIEKKRTVLIGEIVNGGPLPNPPRYTPVCSFDSNHKYIGDTVSLEPPSVAIKDPRVFVPLPAVNELPQPEEEIWVSQTVMPETPVRPQSPPLPPPKPKPVYSDHDLMAVVDSVVEEVLQAEVSGVAKDGAEYASAALSVSENELEVVFSEVVTQMCRDLCASEIAAEKERIAEEKRKQEEARRKREHEAFLNKLSSELCAEITNDVLTWCIRETADAEMKHALEEKAACLARCSLEVCNDLVEETLDVVITQLAKEVLDANLRRIRKFIKRWRDVVTVRRQLKRQMRGFPAAPCCVDPRFKLKALTPSAPSLPSLDTLAKGFINLGNSGNMVASSKRLLQKRKETIHQMRVNFYYNLLLSEHVWTPLDLPTLVAEFTTDPPNRIFWKAAVLLPSSQDNDMNFANKTLTKWLEVKLSGEQMTESMSELEGKLETLSINNSLRNIGQKSHKVHICLKVSHGPLSEKGQRQLEEQKGLLGTSALLMLLPLLPPQSDMCQTEEDVPILSALLQLKQLQKAGGLNSALPLAIIIPRQQEDAYTDQMLEEVLMLKTLVKDGLISKYIFIYVSGNVSDLQLSQEIGEALSWLVAHSPASTVLTSQALLQFVEDGLCNEFHTRFLRDKQERAQANLLCQNPAAVVQLYNSVLDYLANVVSSDLLAGLSGPLPEFSLPENRDVVPQMEWNSPQHLTWLKHLILSLQIPEWDEPDQNASWHSLCASICQYVSQIPSSPQMQTVIMSHLDHLLGRVHAQYLNSEDGKVGPAYNYIPWDDILFLCVQHRMKDWHLPEGPVAKDTFTENGEILVYYYKDWVKDFTPPESWVAAVKCTHKEKQQVTECLNSHSTLRETPSARLPTPRQRLFQSQLETEESHSVLDITYTPSAEELLPHRLLSSIEKEKAHSQRFEEQLQRWLKVDPLDLQSVPLLVPSTLLSVPEILAPNLRPCLKESGKDGSAARSLSSWKKDPSLSLTQQLQDLDRLILANQQEEIAFNFKLKNLMEIVEN